jgi:hypothetical protein
MLTTVLEDMVVNVPSLADLEGCDRNAVATHLSPVWLQ